MWRFVGLIVRQTKMCLLFCIWRRDATRKTDVFFIHFILKTKQNLEKKDDIV